MSTNHVTGFPVIRYPLSQVTPFTYRDGWTYLEVLENFRSWVNKEIVPIVNENAENMQASFDAALEVFLEAVQKVNDAEQAVQDVQAIFDELQANGPVVSVDGQHGFVQLDPLLSAHIDERESTTRAALNRINPILSDGESVTEILAALNEVGSVVLRGHFVFDEPLVIPSHTKVDATNATITVADTWNYAQRGVIEFVETEHAEWNGGVFDVQGRQDRAILFMGALSNKVDNVALRNFGAINSDPSSGTIAFAALSDNYDSNGNIPPVYHSLRLPVAHNKLSNISIELGAEYRAAFGIRLLTDWELGRSHADTVNRIHNNTFENLRISGNYLWNMFEFAGSGTQHNKIKGLNLDGQALGNLDFDKGSSWNVVTDVTITNAGLPIRHLTNTNVDLHVIGMQGIAELRGIGNTVSNVVIGNIDNPETRDHSNGDAAIYLSYCNDCVIENVQIAGLNNAVRGAAIWVNHGAANNYVRGVVSKGTRAGINTNANSSTHHGNKFIDCELESVGFPACSVAASGPITGWKIRGGRYATTGNAAQTVLIGSQTRNALVSGIEIAGGTTALQFSGDGGTITECDITGDTNGMQIGGPAAQRRVQVINNTVDAPTPYAASGNAAKAHRSGNTFDGVQTYGNSAPNAGTWKNGDIVWNTNVGSFLGWVCTSGGTPGTWAPITVGGA